MTTPKASAGTQLVFVLISNLKVGRYLTAQP